MTKFLSKDGKFYMRDGKLLGYTPPPPIASLTPQPGVTYTSGLPTDWNIMKEIAKMVSEASDSINADTIGSIYVHNGTWAYKITPGNTINVNNHLYAVMGFNNFALTNQNNYGGTHSTAGLTFGTVDCVGEYQMNSDATNSGGWGNCLMRTSTMPTLQRGMPATLAQVKVPYVNYHQSTIVYSDDYMFLPAEKEVWGSNDGSPLVEANALTQFAYYKNGGSTIKNFSGSADVWWVRSVENYGDGYFCCVGTDGEMSRGDAYNPFGAAPCFCV